MKKAILLAAFGVAGLVSAKTADLKISEKQVEKIEKTKTSFSALRSQR
jgi:hypothetical protein